MEQFLKICTTECPFRTPAGDLYVQHDGVSMGSPLGPTFANYYMCDLENRAFSELQVKPIVYCRYVDDCFVSINNLAELESLKTYFEDHSVLTFTYEIEINKKLPFLDVLVERKDGELHTAVYRKSTNTGECINYNSICPERYKTAVINTFLHRAYTVCSTWELFHSEVSHIRKLLVNNNFPIGLVDETVKKFVDNKFQNNANADNATTEQQQITLYYRNQFTSNYKAEERTLKQLVRRHVEPSDPNSRVTLSVFYRNRKLRHILMNNRPNNQRVDSRVVYDYKCPESGCNAATYVGYTTCTLTQRFYIHVQTGSIHQHNRTVHHSKPKTQQLLPRTSVLFRSRSTEELRIAETLLIKERKPLINQQDGGFTRTLKVF